MRIRVVLKDGTEQFYPCENVDYIEYIGQHDRAAAEIEFGPANIEVSARMVFKDDEGTMFDDHLVIRPCDSKRIKIGFDQYE